MITTEKATNILNDLSEINLDRVTGLEKADKELPDSDPEIKTVFNKLAAESRSNSK